MKMKMNKRHQ